MLLETNIVRTNFKFKTLPSGMRKTFLLGTLGRKAPGTQPGNRVAEFLIKVVPESVRNNAYLKRILLGSMCH